jgi:hypothetical protein
MQNKANQRILGMTRSQLLILGALGGVFLCVVLAFGGYIIFGSTRSVPAALPPTSIPTVSTLTTQLPVAAQPTIRSTNTATSIPKAPSRPTFTAIPTGTSFVVPTLSIPTAIPTATETLVPPPPEIPIEFLLANLTKCEKVIYDTYWVVLKYPTIWGCDKRESLIKSTGPGGFMEISLRGGFKVADTFCKKRIESAEGEELYGKNPTLKMLVIDNQPACMIFPSGDQAAKYKKISLLAVNYPQSTPKGKGLILLIYADKSHIQGFANSLRFAPPEQ